MFKFGKASKRGWCSTNPCEDAEKPKLERSQIIRYLTVEELEAVLRQVRTDTPGGPTDRVLILTAAMTGLRQGELLALRWEDVDWAASTIRVRRNYVRGEWGTPKSKRASRAVPMATRIARELEQHFKTSNYAADGALVFPHPHSGSTLGHSQPVVTFKEALAAAGVREVLFHDLRHTFGTQMASAGVPMRTLQEWMGHVDLQTTQIYADYQPRAADAALVEAAFAPVVLAPGKIGTTLVPLVIDQ